MNRKRWQTSPVDKELASQIAEECALSPMAAMLAAARGLKDPEEIGSFFDDTADVLSDPFELKDMKAAADRVNRAIEDGEKIAVFGDYDADGVCASAMLVSYLRTRAADVMFHIPDRQTEGYGLSAQAVRKLKEDGASLIVTVDNGVSAIEEAELIAELGMELVVTDHHKTKGRLPRAVAVVNPHREDNSPSFKDYSGTGVAFKLICAVEGADSDWLLEEYGDLLALGTIGDVVPLKGENRTMVIRGLRVINSFPREGMKALIVESGLGDKKVDSMKAAFVLAPKINAAGRMGSADRAMDLLLCEDSDKAKELAAEITQENKRRQAAESEILEKIEQVLNDSPSLKYEKVIVVDGEGWHTGVIGIVASRLVEKYGRPCIVISKEGDTARGSCRSLEGFSIFEALSAVSDCLTHFGGHTLAAGFGIECARIEEFKTALRNYSGNIDMPYPVQRIDLRLKPEGINAEITDAITAFEPFGAENPRPVFGLIGMILEECKGVSEDKYTRLTVSRGTIKLSAICFSIPFDEFPYRPGDTIDLAVTLEKTFYMGTENVGVYVRNIRLSGMDEEAVLSGFRIYEDFMRNEGVDTGLSDRVVPGRNLIASVYRLLKAGMPGRLDYEIVCRRLGDDGGKICAVMLAVDALTELGILSQDVSGRVRVNEECGKVELTNSKIYRQFHTAGIG